MRHVFELLTAAVTGAAPLAVAAGFAWGALSVLLSPCHLASIPLVVGWLQGQEQPGRGRALALAGLFAAGILATVAMIGAATVAAGRMAGDVGPAGSLAVAAVFVAVGLHFLGLLPLPLPAPARVGSRRRGAWAALALGLVFGLALGPCTFAFLAPVLAAAFRTAAADAVLGGALLLAYALGHCLVIAVAGAGSAWVQRALDWHARSRAALRVRRVCGALVVLGGLWLLYTAP